jgi:hypothetical protein
VTPSLASVARCAATTWPGVPCDERRHGRRLADRPPRRRAGRPGDARGRVDRRRGDVAAVLAPAVVPRRRRPAEAARARLRGRRSTSGSTTSSRSAPGSAASSSRRARSGSSSAIATWPTAASTRTPRSAAAAATSSATSRVGRRCTATRAGLRRKSLVLAPYRLAIALCDDGWILRDKVVWAKTNGLPESVQDRLHVRDEVILRFTLREKAYFDVDAIREKYAVASLVRDAKGRAPTFAGKKHKAPGSRDGRRRSGPAARATSTAPRSTARVGSGPTARTRATSGRWPPLLAARQRLRPLRDVPAGARAPPDPRDRPLGGASCWIRSLARARPRSSRTSCSDVRS